MFVFNFLNLALSSTGGGTETPRGSFFNLWSA